MFCKLVQSALRLAYLLFPENSMIAWAVLVHIRIDAFAPRFATIQAILDPGDLKNLITVDFMSSFI